PDLVYRFQHNEPIAELDRATLFGGSEKGYTDYPELP
ncbi:MAG: alkene reductase, partial [Opitutales bacterium]